MMRGIQSMRQQFGIFRSFITGICDVTFGIFTMTMGIVGEVTCAIRMEDLLGLIGAVNVDGTRLALALIFGYAAMMIEAATIAIGFVMISLGIARLCR